MGRRRSLFPRSRRSRRSSGSDAALAVIVGGALLVAALGIYLVIVGALALVGWLAIVSARRSSNTAIVTSIAATTAATCVPPPNQQFHVVIPVEPLVFDEPARLAATTRTVFSRWARQLPKSPRRPELAIRKLERRARLIGRLTSRLDGRRFVWRCAPYRGRDRMVGAAAIDPASLDPYSPPLDLRTRSSILSLCKSCGGDGKCECTRCGGAGKVGCSDCTGEGKVYGFTKNGHRRLLNCKSCKGKGAVSCHACTKGQILCGTCDRSGRVEHWLEVEGGPRDADVQVEPDGDQTRAFSWGKDGAPASQDEIAKDARVVCSVSMERLIEATDLPPTVPQSWIDANWVNIQARLQPGERIVAQTFTLLEVPAVEVTYGLRDDYQSIELDGLRLLGPPISFDRVFTTRARALTRLAYGLLAVPAIVTVAYLARGSYFAKAETAAIVALTSVATVVVYQLVARASLGQRPWRWLAVLLVPVTVAIALAISVEPRASRARALIDSGQLDLAERELEALSVPPLDPLWADLHLRNALASTSCMRTTSIVAKMPSMSAQAVEAQAHADALAVAAGEEALQRGALDDAGHALDCASESYRSISEQARTLRVRIRVAGAGRCIGSSDWTCAFENARAARSLGAGSAAEQIESSTRAAIRSSIDASLTSAKTDSNLGSRVSHQQHAIELWTKYLLAEQAAEPAELTALRTRAKRDLDAFNKEQNAKRLRQQAEDKKRAAELARQRVAEERAEKRRLAEEARRERQSTPLGLRCCDGTLSPTCMCGGSRRGCCSHHGGVCGCE